MSSHLAMGSQLGGRRRPLSAEQCGQWLLFEGLASGAGMPCDWVSARQVARKSQLILAGGLNATNVATALAEVSPFGVDVSSGVEERPCIKSQTEIARFVAAARNLVSGRAMPAQKEIS